MVHAAIFDAVNAIDRRYKPYLSGHRGEALVLAGCGGRRDRRVPRPRRAATSLRTRSRRRSRVAHADLRDDARQPSRTAPEGRRDRHRRGRRVGHDRRSHRLTAASGIRVPRPTPGHSACCPATGGRPRPRPQRSRRVAEERRTVLRPRPGAVPSRAARTRSRATATRASTTRSSASARRQRVRTHDQTAAARFWGTGQRGRDVGHADPHARRRHPTADVRRCDRARFYALIYLKTADTAIATWTGQGEVVVLAARDRDPAG